MVIKNVNLETVCGITSKIPQSPYMEFAFAGKSNVGKSSLINGERKGEGAVGEDGRALPA